MITLPEEALGLGAEVAGFFDGDDRVGSERERLLLALETVGHAPEL